MDFLYARVTTAVAIIDNNLTQTEGLLHLLGHEETAKTHLFFWYKGSTKAFAPNSVTILVLRNV